MSLLGDRLKELRGSTSQAEMARSLGMPRPQWIRYETGQTVPGADILANICRIHACSADWLLGIDKSRTALSVIGNGNAVAQGTGAKAVATVKCEPGELPQCAKCPIKKRLARIERAMTGK